MSYKPSVAVIGINGALGPHVLAAFKLPQYSEKIQLPLIAITRSASGKESDSNIRYTTAAIDDLSALTSAFKDVDVVINLVGLQASHDTIVKAAADSGVKVFFPSEFGMDSSDSKYAGAFAFEAHVAKYARSLGLKTVEVQTNEFLDWGIANPNLLLEIDLENSRYSKVGDGKQTISGTFLADIGKAVAKLSTIPAADLPDVVRTHSGSFTIPEMVATYEKASGKKLQPVAKPVKDYTDAADAVLAAGIRSFEDLLVILKAILFTGGADFSKANDNEFVNPGGKDFEWTDFHSELAKQYSK